MARLARTQVIKDNSVENSQQKLDTLSKVLGDVHFLVPAIVLIAGLLLLRWVS
jgi:hypothetical protein